MSITKFRQRFASGPFLRVVLYGIVAVFIIGIPAIYFGGFGKGDDDRSQSDWLAKVNGEQIPREPFDKQMRDWSKQVEDMRGMRPSSSEVASYMSQGLSQTIMRETLRQAAEKQGIRVSGREVDEAIDKRLKEQMDSLRQSVEARLTKGKKKPSRSEVDREIEAMIRVQTQNDNATIDSFEQEQRNGIDRNELETQLAIQKLSENLSRSGRMSEQELIDSYRQVSVSRILVKPVPAEAQAKRKADQILSELNSGQDFATLAKAKSDDPMTKKNGGAFPFPLTQAMAQGMRLDPTLTRAIFALPVGKVSNVLRTADGFEIVKVTAEKSTLPKDFQQKKKQYMDQALQAKRSQISSEFMQKTMKSAKIELPQGDLRGYWFKQKAMEAGQAGDFEGYKKNLEKAIPEFQAAIVTSKSSDGPSIFSLAQIYQTLGQPKPALLLLQRTVQNPTWTVDGADFRMLLGDLYASQKDNKSAVAQYELASQVGIADENAHQQLIEKFKKMGRADLAAKEKAFVDQAAARRARAAVPTAAKQTSAPVPPTQKR